MARIKLRVRVRISYVFFIDNHVTKKAKSLGKFYGQV